MSCLLCDVLANFFVTPSPLQTFKIFHYIIGNLRLGRRYLCGHHAVGVGLVDKCYVISIWPLLLMPDDSSTTLQGCRSAALQAAERLGLQRFAPRSRCLLPGLSRSCGQSAFAALRAVHSKLIDRNCRRCRSAAARFQPE
jgi:hypothetical protein